MVAERKRMLRQPCHYCGGAATSRDHIVPVAKYGVDAMWNLVPSCRSCQESKAQRTQVCSCAFCSEAYARWEAGERRTTIPRGHRTADRARRRYRKNLGF